ncbi:sensor histidine kinase [Oceanobacillus sp. CAU 1775]
MGTKWKSSLTTLLITSLLFTIGITGIFLLVDHGYYYGQKSYFHTPEFEYGEVDQFTGLFDTFEVNDLSLEEAKEGLTVSRDEIEEHRYRFGDLSEQIESINFQYEEMIEDALSNERQTLADSYIEDRDSKIADITKNFESEEHIEAKVLQEKEKALEEYYKNKENHRAQYEQLKESFQYYFKDTVTGEVFTNMTSEDAQVNDINSSNMLYFKQISFMNWNYIPYESSGMEYSFEVMSNGDREFEGRIGVPTTLASSHPYMQLYEEYKVERVIFWSLVALTIITLILSVLIFKKAKKMRIEIKHWSIYYNKLPIDIRFLLLGVTLIFTFISFLILINQVYYITTAFIPSIVIGVLIATLGLALSYIQSIYLLSTIKDWKVLEKEWKLSLSYRGFLVTKKSTIKLIERLKLAFLGQSIGIQILLLFGLVFALGLASILAIMHPLFILIYILILGIIGIPTALMIINKIGDFNQIVENTNELAAGNLRPDLHVKGDNVLAKLAQNINELKQGVKQSQSEQAKSERLKTELITNVSHDLRTPLTSVITYTELLKNQNDLGDESAAYLEIIDRKSKRLKVLIDDLFEISKMTSGNIELQKARVDLVQLLQQSLGEYDDMITASGLQFRVTFDDPPIETVVDGQKLWRVFDNLIENILKYSLEQTRVYINLSVSGDKAIFSFKNVSKYELNENTNELSERFKRGDTSRQTDGSGLGLAIAQSIVELHHGSMTIETDGDLFKVTIELPL